MGIWRLRSVIFISLVCTVSAFVFLISFSCDAILPQCPFFTGNGGRSVAFLPEVHPNIHSGLSEDSAVLESPPRKDDPGEDEVVSANKVPGANISSYAAFDKFTISPDDCSASSPPFLLLVVFTRFDAFERRNVIRKTYGSVVGYGRNMTDSCGYVPKAGEVQKGPRGVRLLFIVGKKDNTILQEKLESEAKLFGDIIQSDAFIDTYGEATRKGISLIHWSLLHCPHATFTAKADDDCWINLPLLVKTLRRYVNDTPSILGHFWPNGASVIRDPSNKWSVSLTDYPSKRYPPYLSGILYIFHGKTLAPIAQAVSGLKYLWHDDVFITGVAAAKAGIPHIGLGGYDVMAGGWKRWCAKGSQLAMHYVNEETMMRLWRDNCETYTVPC